jgi:E3 ubiquitin-protein ligase RAD18
VKQDTTPKEGEQPQQSGPMDLSTPPPPPANLEPEKDLPTGYHNATAPQENFPARDNPPPSGQRVPPPPLPSTETSLPEQYGGQGARTINMFEVSSHPVADVETTQENGGH